MWVLDYFRDGVEVTGDLRLNTVRAAPDCIVVSGGECEHTLFRGTEAECRAYIADLMERLNAPAIITQGMTEQILREIKRLEGDIRFAHDRIYKLEKKTRGLEPDLR